MKQIIRANIYGDSIMKGTVIDEGYRYHAVMGEYLSKLYNLFSVEADNRSRFGITIERGHSILKKDAAEGLDCELALIEYGGNDSNYRWDEISLHPEREHLPLTTLESFKHTLTVMVEELRASGVQPVLMTLPTVDSVRYLDFLTRNGNNKANILRWLKDVYVIEKTHDSYSAAIRAVAKDRMVPMVDVQSAFEADARGKKLKEYICIDGIHPTQKGYSLIANTFAQFLRQGLPA